MNKDYLDYLYGLKALVQNDIDRLDEAKETPQLKCCENMDGTSEVLAELRTRRSQMIGIDETIHNYLKMHN